MPACEKCGEGLVCPKCQTVREAAESIVIRHKGPGNGGAPNLLIITPAWKNEKYNYTMAVLVGDNFFRKGHYQVQCGSVAETAHWIAESDLDYMASKFDLNKPQERHFASIQAELKALLKAEVD